MMRFPDDDGLPLWLFILIILLTAVSITLILFVVWCKCIKRSRKLEPLSSEISNCPERKISARNGQIVRASWNVSLTGPRFGSGMSRQQRRRPSHQWPGTTCVEGHHESIEKPSYHQSPYDADSLEDQAASVRGRSWSDLVRRQNSPAWRPRDEESIRASYISLRPDKSQLEPGTSKLESQWLDSPTLISPITPFTLPRTPHSPARHPATLQSLSRYATVPLPAKAYRISRYCEGINPLTSTNQTHSNKLESRSPRCHPQSQACRSSTTTRESFLHAWSSAYHGWLSDPDIPSGSAPTRPVHFDVMPITDLASETSEDHEADISLPSLTPVVSIRSRSPVSRPHSFGTSLSNAEKKEGGIDTWVFGHDH